MTSIVFVRSPSTFSLLARRHVLKHSAHISTPRICSPSRTLFTTNYTLSPKTKETTKKSPPRNESLANAQSVPWHYEDVDKPPVQKNRESNIKDKGTPPYISSQPSHLIPKLTKKHRQTPLNTLPPTKTTPPTQRRHQPDRFH